VPAANQAHKRGNSLKVDSHRDRLEVHKLE
jgi:hypothetical protein